jgi:oxygen-independent coproporphyrinogen-3 oxidase
MRQEPFINHLPDDYFTGKDGTTYRFTILKDIAVAGSAAPVPYEENRHREEVLGLYGKYRDFTLYVHFPWCVEHCSYCHYYRSSMVKRQELSAMLDAERRHAQMMDEWIDLKNRDIRSIYFGGGTPTVVPANMMEETMGYFVERYGVRGDCETCAEASIITLKSKKIDILERYINRLSLGVQSFDDRILKVVERKHTGSQAREVLREVVPRFPSVNVDLIFGLYTQGLDVWLESVETAIQLRIPSLTIYRLDIRETPAIIDLFRKEPEQFADEQMCRRMYEEARTMLEAAGYRENLVGWFLLPQVKDTTVYRERWEKQSPCIAFGNGLHNYAADHFYETFMDKDKYIGAVNAGKLPVEHIYPMTAEKQLIWYVMAQLKSNSPVYRSVMKERFGPDLLQWFLGLIRNYISWGVLEESGDRIDITTDSHYILEWMLLELIAALR